MAAHETMQERRAALLLHGLPPAERLQVMAKLDVAQSSRLKQLLDELAALGVSQPLGRQLQHLTSLPQSDASISNAGKLTVHEQLERLSAEDIAQCLEPCAASTVAELLRAGAWPWKMPVLDRMADARRVEVVTCLRKKSPALAPAVLASLCERLCQQAAHLHANPAQASASLARRFDTSRPAKRTQLRARLRRLIRWTR